MAKPLPPGLQKKIQDQAAQAAQDHQEALQQKQLQEQQEKQSANTTPLSEDRHSGTSAQTSRTAQPLSQVDQAEVSEKTLWSGFGDRVAYLQHADGQQTLSIRLSQVEWLGVGGSIVAAILLWWVWCWKKNR